MRHVTRSLVIQIQLSKLFQCRFFGNSTNSNVSLHLDRFTQHTDIKGLYVTNDLLSGKDLTFLLSNFDRHFYLAFEKLRQKLATMKYYDETGKTAHEIYIEAEADETNPKTQQIRASLFTEYHRESNAAKHGKHHALTFPNQIPKFIEPLINKLHLKTYRPKYLFLNDYELAKSTEYQPVFDWHIDLHVFGEITIICDLTDHGILQLVPMTKMELLEKKDGFQNPSNVNEKDKIIDVPTSKGTVLLLTNEARYHYAHRLIMPCSERKSIALGMVENKPPIKSYF